MSEIMGKETEKDTAAAMSAARAGRCVPLAGSQRGVYFECVERPGSTAYNDPFMLCLPFSVDIDRLEAAVARVMRLHPVLFTTFRLNGDEPVMIPGEGVCRIERAKKSGREEVVSTFVKPFDIENGPLYRFAIYETPEGNFFLMDIHHLIFDGLSLRMLYEQIAAAYAGQELSGERKTLFDVAEGERGLQDSEAYAEARAFFEEQFKEKEFEAELISDVDASSERGTNVVSLVSDDRFAKADVEKFIADTGIRISTLLLGAFAYTQSVFSGMSDSCFATASNGRHRDPELKDTLGMFVKTLPMKIHVPKSGSVLEYLKGVQELFRQTLSHDVISFGELNRDHGVHAGISFVYEGIIGSEIRLGDDLIMPEELALNDCPSDLLCLALKREEDYEFRVHYRTDRFSEGYARSFGETLLTVLGGLIRCADLGGMKLITDATEAFYDEINRTERPYDPEETVNSLLERAIAGHEDAPALVYRDRRYSYRDFDRITRSLAAYVAGLGIGKDDFAAVLSERNDNAVLAAWGIVRCGVAFQMLDPAYPAERLNYMVNDSRAKLLIADRELAPVLTGYSGPVLYTDGIASLPEAPGFTVNADRRGAITLIYTSGTTGNPKGCVLENRNLVAFYHNHRECMGLDGDSRVASYASFGFDAGIMDVITTPLAGGCLYIIPDEMRLDLDAVERFYCDNGITHGFMTTQVGRTFAEETRCRTLKAFLVGGEKLIPFTPQSAFRFINGYGPCETMAYICHYDVKDNSRIQPIGRPSGNTKLYVLDGQDRRVPVGAPGELAIAGLQVGRGYLGLPEKTAQAFTANPCSAAEDYGRVYRTGDVVRILPGGDIEYIGRHDSQVKVRGYRVELTEIEEVIRRFDGVKDAAVVALDEKGGGKYIAAYVAGPEKIDIEALHDFIRSEKPAYLVPAVTMQLDKIPYTQNHKVNRRALPVPERRSSDDTKPENETQQRIYDIAAEVLGHESFGIMTDLGDAGLTSIGALKLNSRLGREFGVPVKLADIREHSTVKELAAFLDGAAAAEDAGAAEDYPLMGNQMGVFTECLTDRGSLRYNIPLLLRVSKEIDAGRLCDAFRAAIDAHPYMKATLMSAADGNVRAVRHDGEKSAVELIEADELPPVSSLVRPFDLTGGRLYRAAVYVTGDANYLFLDVHHIISDGTSLAILLSDVDKAYNGQRPEKERYTGFEAALWEQKAVSGPEYAASEAYYQKLLEGVNTECLPEKCPAGEGSGAGSFVRPFGALSERIIEWCKKNKLTANAFFNAVFGFVLSRYIHADDVSYCTVYNGRNDSRLSESCAMLVKTLPMRMMPAADDTVTGYVEAVQKQLLDSMSFDTVSFAELSRRYGLKGDLFFNFQGDSFNFDRLCGKEAALIPVPTPDVKATLSIEMFLVNGEYRAEAAYDRGSFCEEFVSSFTSSLVKAAESFIGAEKLKEVSILSAEEEEHFARMNDTHANFENIPAQVLFERQAAERPDSVAVRTENESLTFAELDDMANRIANALIARGAKSGEIVGAILERTVLVPAVEIGILKAGCAFLPMLPTYPDDRLDYCMRDADCRFVICAEETIEAKPLLFAADRPYRAIAIGDMLREGGSAWPSVTIAPDQPVYCIYTSGSTGTPKGVLIEHHNLTNFVQTSALREVEERSHTILCMASVSFDMSITEIFFSLCCGNTLYIATEDEVHNPDRLLKAFTLYGIDLMMMTPSFAWSLLSLPGFDRALSQLNGVVLGAEAFQPVLLSRFKALNNDMLVQNGYGPTECTQVCSVKTLEEGGSITIGKPFANMKYYVADEQGHLLPRYAVGELMICGENVCRGYVKLPEKNREAFTEINGLKAYHSGDMVRVNRDNEVEFGGRKDNQVKLRGFRVELDEVEKVMQEYPGIAQCRVIVRNNGTEDFLAGYFTAADRVDIEALSAYMKTKLTYYMVPAAMMQLDRMPMTSNGKLDKKALPEISPVRKTREKRAPRKSLEQKITELFRDVLNEEECWPDDNFFEIGGTSLSASRVVMLLKAEGYAVEYQDIFDHQSPAELAEYLEGQKAPGGKSEAAEDTALYGEEDDIREALKHNTMEHADELERRPLGNVLLTGATGFLGAHVLKTLLDTEEGHITCLLRRGRFSDLFDRLTATMVYYFEDDCGQLLRERVSVFEADITDADLTEKCDGLAFDTIINCAACVKHYANDDSIERVNVHGVENLIRLAEKRGAKLIQISTTSVPGMHTAETWKTNLQMPEDRLFVIDDINNQYIRSKYQAEKLVLGAVRKGLRAKIIRVGNLMGRYSDGEFQTNMRTNAFLNGLRGFVNIGKCPISHATDPMSFSPIDCTARAVVLLAGTNDIFTAFNADTRFTFDEMKVMEAMNRCGIPVKPVPDEEYYADYYRIMADPEKNSGVAALLTGDRPDMHPVKTENRFTANILFRLGFSWPFVDDDYLDRVIKSLDTLAFFEEI